MAKKTKDDVPNPNSVSNRDILQRLNFLYQASALLGTIDTPPREMAAPVPASLKGKERRQEMRKRNRERHSTAPADLSRTYVRSMKAIGQKTNMRLCVFYSNS
jgi:ribonuclease P protein subunit RPR2